MMLSFIPNLHDYDFVIINSSGGKDSQTMMRAVVALADAQNYSRDGIIVAHADLGRVEWEGTKELCQEQAEYYGLAFQAIARPQGDLLFHVQQRGMWPSPQQRYCTSDHKRGQIAKIITRLDRAYRELYDVKTTRVLNCMGLRAEESPARKKKPIFTSSAYGSTKSRQVDLWLPIHDWTEDTVWKDIKASGVPYHPAYDLGMPRLSCCFCIFAPRSALVLAGHHNKALLEEYVLTEIEIEHTFRQDLSLLDIYEAVERGEAYETEKMTGDWNM